MMSGLVSLCIAIDGVLFKSLPIEGPVSMPSVSPNALAYVVYTSGIIGSLKVCLHSHQGFTSYTRNVGPWLAMDSNTRAI
jgi:acyl-coenzyme A synthetase/AMP-(fatty) acid ligase